MRIVQPAELAQRCGVCASDIDKAPRPGAASVSRAGADEHRGRAAPDGLFHQPDQRLSHFGDGFRIDQDSPMRGWWLA
jgi:hypothetical protein